MCEAHSPLLKTKRWGGVESGIRNLESASLMRAAFPSLRDPFVDHASGPRDTREVQEWHHGPERGKMRSEGAQRLEAAQRATRMQEAYVHRAIECVV